MTCRGTRYTGGRCCSDARYVVGYIMPGPEPMPIPVSMIPTETSNPPEILSDEKFPLRYRWQLCRYFRTPPEICPGLKKGGG